MCPVHHCASSPCRTCTSAPFMSLADPPFMNITTTAPLTDPPGMHWEQGHCPNVGSACNCIGTCRPRLVPNDPREDYQGRHRLDGAS